MAKIPEIMKDLKEERPYFDFSKVILSERKYVAWIDLMGSASVLAVSDVQAGIFIGKLHSAILKAREMIEFEGNAYPFVDGCYLISSNRTDIQSMLKVVFKLMALSFIFEATPEHRSVPRASLSFGQVIEGSDIGECAKPLKDNQNYTSGILFGTPLSLAYHSEKFASPFGVWIEQNARHFCPPSGRTIRTTFWEWWSYPTKNEAVDLHCDQIEKILAEELDQHLDWCSRHSHRILYSREAIVRHREIASQYFTSWPRR